MQRRWYCVVSERWKLHEAIYITFKTKRDEDITGCQNTRAGDQQSVREQHSQHSIDRMVWCHMRAGVHVGDTGHIGPHNRCAAKRMVRVLL
jgi:hypothetical protein